jgi:hypothetical protein
MPVADGPTLAQEISAMAGSAFTGATAFRYGRIFAQALPRPDATSGKLYEFFFNLVQGLADNQHLRTDNGNDQSGSGKEAIPK